MIDQIIFILNVAIISMSQIFLMFKYLQQKKTSKFIGDLTIYCVILSFLLYEHYFKLNIPDFILTFSVITVIGHTFVGSYLNIYYKSNYFDRYLHLFGSFSFSLLAFSIINYIAPLMKVSWIYTFLFVMTLGISIGVFFEIIEFAHDSFSKKIMCQHGLADTDFDMIFNVFGSFIAGVVSITIFL